MSDSIIGIAIIDIDVDEAIEEIERNWGWFLAEGMLQVIFGTLALIFPILSTAYVGVYANAALVACGIINMMGLIFAERGFKIRSFLIGAVQVYLGALLEYYPLESLEAVTSMIAYAYVIDGLFRIIAAEQNRDLPGWFWTLVGGVGSVAVGVYTLATLPLSSLETIGTLVGFHLLSAGSSRIQLASLGRAMAIEDKKKRQ